MTPCVYLCVGVFVCRRGIFLRVCLCPYADRNDRHQHGLRIVLIVGMPDYRWHNVLPSVNPVQFDYRRPDGRAILRSGSLRLEIASKFSILLFPIESVSEFPSDSFVALSSSHSNTHRCRDAFTPRPQRLVNFDPGLELDGNNYRFDCIPGCSYWLICEERTQFIVH